mmetsp:Transcript_91150/g.162280  ORF Transcript_91150/g.162280 Transcript_91150/m.162280 type:complete len:201 (+) Transcript_91150:70-672(+)
MTGATAKLPKLQIPKDEEAQRRIEEASELARDGDLKAAQKILKEAIASGLFPKPLQREVLAWWSAGQYDLLKDVPKVTPQTVANPERSVAKNEDDEMEAQVVKIMKERQMSRKEACQYIDEGGLEMEQMRAEMNAPMDQAFEDMKNKGPPQWFIDSMTKVQEEAKAKEEGYTAGSENPEAPAGAPMALGPAGAPVALGPS